MQSLNAFCFSAALSLWKPPLFRRCVHLRRVAGSLELYYPIIGIVRKHVKEVENIKHEVLPPDSPSVTIYEMSPCNT